MVDFLFSSIFFLNIFHLDTGTHFSYIYARKKTKKYKKSLRKRRVPFWKLCWQFSVKSFFFSLKLYQYSNRVLKKILELNFFPEKIFSWRNLSGQIKTKFCKSVFKVQKTSAECLEKVLMNSYNQKKTVYLDKFLRICASQFWQSCWSFLTIVRFFN